MISFFTYHNTNSMMTNECEFKIIILLLFFIIFYLFFITIVGFGLIFSKFIDWTSLFNTYNFYIDYLKDVFLEKPCDFICKYMKYFCCKEKKEEKKEKKQIDKKKKEQKIR
jgi:hypothetical protein